MADNLWLILESVVEVTNIILCYSLILQAKINTKNGRVFWVHVGIILCSGINFFCELGIDRFSLGMLYCFMLPLVLMKNNKIKWMLLYPCAFMMSSIINIASSFVLAMILEMPQAEMVENAWVGAVTNMFFLVIMGAILIYLKVNKKKSQRKLFWNKGIYVSVTIGTMLFYLLIGLVQYIGSEHDVPVIQTNLLGLFMSGVCIVFFAFFLWLSTTIHYNEMTNRERDMLNLYLEEQEKYTQLIIDKDEHLRKFRHDIKAHMWVISEYIKNVQFDKAQAYIDMVYGELNTADLTSYTGINALDAIIHEKRRIMEEKGITFKWDSSECRISENFEVYDLCTIFSNILNNAIEACEALEQVDKIVEMVVNVDRDKLYIRESNKTNNDVIMDDEGNPVSSKEDKKNHGYGYKNIRAVVEKYDGEINFFVDGQMFCVEIFI